MKKEEYLKKLKFLLIDMPADDLAQIEDFYEELIYDGMEQGYTEEEILAKFESPEEVAKKIRAEYGGLAVYTAKNRGKEDDGKNHGYEADAQLIDTIRVETENLRIRVRIIEEGPIRVYFKPKQGQDIVTFEEKDGVFFFRHEQRRKNPAPLNWLTLFLDYNVLVLEVPMDYAGTLCLAATNASIRLSGLCNLEKGEIRSGNGKIRVENSFAKSLEIQSNNAQIELINVRGDYLEAAAGNGLISVKECRFPSRLSLCTQNGAISGRNLISDHIEMQTSNGFVTATVIGNPNDYNINSTTHHGFNNLDNVNEPGRTKSLLAKTHNGRIQIDFSS